METKNKFLSGQQARDMLRDLLLYVDGKPVYQVLKDERKRVCGVYRDGETWVTFDNATGDCWVEEFKNEADATAWLRGD